MYFKISTVVGIWSIITLLLTKNICDTQSVEKCAKVGEYCQTHWDCCSKSCHSYLMRCTQGQVIYPYDFFGINPIMPANAAQSTLEEILQINFGDGSQLLDNNIQSTRKHESNANTKRKLQTNSATITEVTKVDASNNIKQRQQRSLQDHIMAVSIDGCKTIPAKCYRDDECCTKRCHNFLHQCVT